MKKSVLITIILITSAFSASYFFYQRYFTIPDFNINKLELVDLKQNNFQVNTKREKPLIIHFWGTWCGPCRSEMPDIQKIYDIYKDKIDFVLISDERSIEQLPFYIEKYQFNLPFYHSIKPLKDYDVYSIPVTYFYDQQGILVHSNLTPLRFEEWGIQIEKLLPQ
jgi:thiol-disulfide isomerase/thioredoxin